MTWKSKPGRRSGWIVPVLLAVAVATVGVRPVAAQSSATPPPPAGPGGLRIMSFDVLPAGNPAPDFSVATLGGATLSKEGLAGKVVLIDFWASWCLPCREAVPQLQALQQQLAGEPFVILGVSLDQDESAMRRFLADHGPTWPQHWDRGHQLVRRFQVKELPSYVVIGHDGRVTYSRKGYSATAGKILDHQVKTAVARVRQTQAAAAKP